MKKHDAFVDYVLELLQTAGDITAQAMFGGYGIYKDGVIVAIIVNSRLYFKVCPDNRADYEQRGSQPFTYKRKNGKTATMSYWEVPTDIMEDHDQLIAWLEQSYQCSLRSGSAKRKRLTP